MELPSGFLIDQHLVDYSVQNKRPLTMEKPISETDCTDVVPNLDSISQLNRHFQKNSLPEVKFEHQQLGRAHNPMFKATTLFDGLSLIAKGTTKKDCEKKIKTYLWVLISQGILFQEEKQMKKTKSETKKFKHCAFSDFKTELSNVSNINRPMLIVDTENLGKKFITNQRFKEICTMYNIGLICVTSRIVPENEGEIIVFKRESMHKDSADEGIRRIAYYLIDHLSCPRVGLITMDHFGQHLKDVFGETKEGFVWFKDLDEFYLKYGLLVQDITETNPK